MSANQAADRAPTIRDGIRELIVAFRQDLLPSIPRAAILWGIALGATFVIRGVYDVFWPTTDWAVRSHWSTQAGLAICFCAGFQAAWRSRDFGRGGIVTLEAILISFLVAIVGGVAAVLVIDTFHSLDLSRELPGAIEVPFPVVLILGGSVGAVGAAVGVLLSRISPSGRNR
jgi:hypothetical protein